VIASRTEVRVRYADTDQMHIVYHAKYLEYFEQGRSDLLRSVGLPYPRIESLGFHLPVVEAYAKYLKAARYDDLLVVSTVMKDLPLARIRIDYEVRSAGGEELHATGHTCHSFIDTRTGKVSRAPEFFTRAVEGRFHHSTIPD
jgi:acyl-CoA thioester hydrolase